MDNLSENIYKQFKTYPGTVAKNATLGQVYIFGHHIVIFRADADLSALSLYDIIAYF